MALKSLMLRKKIDLKTKELETLRASEEEFKTREAEIEAAIADANDEESQGVVDEAIEALNNDRSAHMSKIADLEKEIGELEAELKTEERAAEDTAAPAVIPAEPTKTEERKVEVKMEKRNRFGLSNEIVTETRAAEFLSVIRDCVNEKRSLTNAGLNIPDVFLGLIKENVINYSKLYRHVYLRSLSGDGKLSIMGNIPEAVWVECCGNINELDLGFARATVDCNKVAGFFPVCNAILEDSDIDLAAQIIEALSIAIGKALDKAILYGSGSGMPLGVYTRLAQTSQPAGYPATARAWVDLHTSNLLSIANTVTGVDLFKTIMIDSAVASGKYSRGDMVWVMNETTYKFLRAQGMSVNAAGAIVSAVDGSMPGVGGIVEVLDFIPNYNIIGGYFDLYLLGERQAITVESAPMVKWTEDETLFRGKARYDGLPVIAEGFLGLAINSASFSAPSFAADVANTPAFVQLDKGAVTLATTTGTAQLHARILNAYGQEVDGTITWASSTPGKATVSDSGKITGVAAGSTVVTATCGDAVAVCNVTVPS